MQEIIEKFIAGYVRSYSLKKGTCTTWLSPLVAYADAADLLFPKLKQIVSPSHAVPTDFLSDAETVIAYFLPFNHLVAESNIPGRESSRAWAVAYVETNTLISDLNAALARKLERHGYKAALIPPTHNFDKVKLISDWSHRHVAYIAGLGKFGLNNMLITARGCCGRVGTIVTNVKIKPTPRAEGEYCLYKLDGSCGKCVDKCVNNALHKKLFDRQKCYAMCLENASRFGDVGLADVCGKCLVGVPCSFVNPVGFSN
ncbi:MAG: epoxyqueuosine reductase [Firmicutes bacterium]|nr:epoxyqueuosine reductase [Bacillota bacterium]